MSTMQRRVDRNQRLAPDWIEEKGWGTLAEDPRLLAQENFEEMRVVRKWDDFP